jgi:hypothetical protein
MNYEYKDIQDQVGKLWDKDLKKNETIEILTRQLKESEATIKGLQKKADMFDVYEEEEGVMRFTDKIMEDSAKEVESFVNLEKDFKEYRKNYNPSKMMVRAEAEMRAIVKLSIELEDHSKKKMIDDIEKRPEIKMCDSAGVLHDFKDYPKENIKARIRDRIKLMVDRWELDQDSKSQWGAFCDNISKKSQEDTIMWVKECLKQEKFSLELFLVLGIRDLKFDDYYGKRRMYYDFKICDFEDHSYNHHPSGSGRRLLSPSMRIRITLMSPDSWRNYN